GNIFDDQVRVSVGITILVKSAKSKEKRSEIRLASVDDYASAKTKKDWLAALGSFSNASLIPLIPDKNHTWLTAGLDSDYEQLAAMGNKGSAQGPSIFELITNGLKSNRDAWVYNFDAATLNDNVRTTIEF